MNHDNNHHNFPYNKPPKDHIIPLWNLWPIWGFFFDPLALITRTSSMIEMGNFRPPVHRATRQSKWMPQIYYMEIASQKSAWNAVYIYRCMHMYIILYDHIIVIIYISLLFHIWWYYDDVSLSSTVPGFMLFYINGRKPILVFSAERAIVLTS